VQYPVIVIELLLAVVVQAGSILDWKAGDMVDYQTDAVRRYRSGSNWWWAIAKPGAWIIIGVFCLSAMAAPVEPEPNPSVRAKLPEHITPQAQEAVDAGLAYLARTQGRDGAWRSNGRRGNYPVAMTSLAGLALLMNGNTTTQGPYASSVDRAARFLLGSVNDNGLIVRLGEHTSRSMHGHGFAMLFLGELYGMTEDLDRQKKIHRALSSAIDLTSRSQSRLGGWYYTPGSTNDEGSVTITQVQGLRACRNAGLAVSKEVIDQAMNYLALSVNSDGGIKYRAGRPGASRSPITAAAVCCWFNAGDYDNPMARRALKFARQEITVEKHQGHYYYAHLYLAQALYLSGPGDWAAYFPKMRDHLIRLQDSEGAWMGDYVGKVYGTAIALVILQLPYNQLPIMQR